MLENYLYFLDMFGVVSFAVTGSLLGQKKNLDPFGIVVISVITAIGGGTIRDIILNHYPIFWIRDISYLAVITATSILTQVFDRLIEKIKDILLICDAVGLGVFTVIGIKTAMALGVHPVICVIMGTVTAVFGGLVRDVICNEIPVILHREIYATACIAGGILFFILKVFAVPMPVNYGISAIFIIAVRMVAIKKNLSLPRIGA